jgi:hypothetical protein
MKFNISLILSGINMTMIENAGPSGQNNGVALQFATNNLTYIWPSNMDIQFPQPYVDPSNPSGPPLILIVIKVREEAFQFDSLETMQSRYDFYKDTLVNHLTRYNNALDMAAVNFNAELVKKANIEKVIVSDVMIIGEFMQNSFPTFSPAMGPNGPPPPSKLF